MQRVAWGQGSITCNPLQKNTMRNVLLVLAMAGCAHTGPVEGPRATILLENQGLDVAEVGVDRSAVGKRVGPREVVCVHVDRPREATTIWVRRGNESASYVVNTVAKSGWYVILPPHLATPEFSIDVERCN